MVNAFYVTGTSGNHYTSKSTADSLIEKVMPQFAHYGSMTHHTYTGLDSFPVLNNPIGKDSYQSLSGMLGKADYSSKTVMNHMKLIKPGIGLY